jgi:hypothetical protein
MKWRRGSQTGFQRLLARVSRQARRRGIFILVMNDHTRQRLGERWSFISVGTGKQLLDYWPQERFWVRGREKGTTKHAFAALRLAAGYQSKGVRHAS